MNRRTFLKITGMGSVAIAAGCNSGQDKNLFSPVRSSEDLITGRGLWYATTCRECPAGCGVIAKNREGRVVKLEGNPKCPVGKGALCMRGQASLQSLYHPDRLKKPMLRQGDRWKEIPFDEAFEIMRGKIDKASAQGPDRIAMVTGLPGSPLLEIMTRFLKGRNCRKPLVFEPFSHDSLRRAHGEIFGRAVLPSYRMEKSDFILGLGADFLETWLSPVVYAGAFKDMHAAKNGGKGEFIHIGPWRSLTAANADNYIPCSPGGEALAALCLIRRILSAGRGRHLPPHFLTELKALVEPYSDEKVKRDAGIESGSLDLITGHLLLASSPLVLGSSSAGVGRESLLADMASTILNLVLDPDLEMYDFNHRHRVEIADDRSSVNGFFHELDSGPASVLLIHGTNPLFTLPLDSPVHGVFQKRRLFKICFTVVPDKTARRSDLMMPVKHFLETWDAYESVSGIVSTMQPAMGRISDAVHPGEFYMSLMPEPYRSMSYKAYLAESVMPKNTPHFSLSWAKVVQAGGDFASGKEHSGGDYSLQAGCLKVLEELTSGISSAKKTEEKGLRFLAVPSIRFFDGRGGDKPWLFEIPDPVTKVSWQAPLLVNPSTMAERGWKEGDVLKLSRGSVDIKAPVYGYDAMAEGLLVMGVGQGHSEFGRYGKNTGANPICLLESSHREDKAIPSYCVGLDRVEKSGDHVSLARTDGSDDQHHRKIAMTVSLKELNGHGGIAHGVKAGLTMNDFPMTLPITEGYDSGRDFYEPHEHDGYRWGMAVDLDRCIGCGACVASCYAENNIGIVGEERILEGREMAWLRIERYRDHKNTDNLVFLPMMCQHCDNAPCESVCPVYAPHHSREGLNNQIYNRCIGTRFCAQNCPYKVRRFNWYEYRQAEPMNLQLNPNVTVRGKGVMEKCSFCIQRIKAAHGAAKNENRKIRDGEVVPACVQTCPTGALTFGNFMDPESRLRWICDDPRAYQVLGYLNTKPAVIYLKKVVAGGGEDSGEKHS